MAETEDRKDAGAVGEVIAGDAAVGGPRPLRDAAPRIGVFICSCGQELEMLTTIDPGSA